MAFLSVMYDDTPHEREYVLYLRKSKGRAGIARQRRDSLAHLKHVGGRVVAEFIDADRTAFAKVGAGPARRAEFDAMLDMLRADTRPIPLGVLAWHADRLDRAVDSAERLIEVCAAGRHPVETARSGSYQLWTPTGRKRFRYDVVDAAYEVDHMIERIEASKREAAAEGRWLGGRRPFGYEPNGITIRPSEAAEIRRVADELLAGTSVRAVARDLNARGVPTSTGGTWIPNAVRRMILRPRNAGLMEHRGEVIGRAQWPAILDEATWRAVRALLLDPSRLTISAPRRHLLSGIAECGICGARMAAATVGSGRDRRRVYKCTQTPHIARNVTALERYITMIVLEWLSQPEAGELLAPTGDDGAVARAVERETLRQRQREAAEMFAAGEIARAQLAAVTAATGKRLAELDQLDAATVHTSALGVFRGGDDVRRVWESLDIERQRAVIREIMRVVVLPIKRGRPKGWTREYGTEWGYFNPDGVLIERRER